MSLEGLSESEIQELEESMVKAIESLGHGGAENVGNVTLRAELGWNDVDRYWVIRNRLLGAGRLSKGKGKGGSVRLATLDVPATTTAIPAAAAGEATTSAPLKGREEDLYDPIASVLKNFWVKEKALRESSVEITAKQGKRDTGGKWSRPDLTVVGVKTYTYVPGRFLDVSTFEVKVISQCDVTAVYEALAHRRAANRSYVIVHATDEELDTYSAELESALEEAARHGIGLIVVGVPISEETWDVRSEAAVCIPSPERLDTFIAHQLSDGTKQSILHWFKA